jgi:hypothetical protein
LPNDGFGSGLWKNVQAIKLGKDGGIEAPVRASSQQGIVVGVDAVAASDAAQPVKAPSAGVKSRRLWQRLLRR